SSRGGRPERGSVEGSSGTDVFGADAPGTGASRTGGALPSGDLYDRETGLLAPAGLLTAVVCGDPDAAGRLAERLGGHPAEPGTPVTLGGVPLDE
ncbi:hypothetical protein NGM37_40045, partial [Streptomyces sp. TRM76130]|nr:hypothetical protein [Streptomyces sp. TRM76130]